MLTDMLVDRCIAEISAVVCMPLLVGAARLGPGHRLSIEAA
jgi:hypothetical protein